jgi:DHA2 family multidrug resistance protein
MATTLGALQYVLEEGNKKDWLDDGLILGLTIFVCTGFISLVIRELTFINPIVDLGAFRNRNFTFGCIYSFVMGVGLYGAVYIMPLFLFQIAGYNTVEIGITMFVTGAFQFMSAPVAAKVFGSGIDKRIMVAIGYIIFGTGCYLNSFLTAEAEYWEFFVPQMLRGFALMFCFMPINDLALGTMKKTEVQNASGLYNLTRNLGGAIGLAIINSLINSKSNIYAQAMRENMSVTSPQVMERLNMGTQMLFGKVDNPELAAFSLLNDLVAREAFVIAINNIYVILSLLFFSSLLLLPFMAMTESSGSSSGAH